jgi:hypothetical protein
MVKLKTRFSNDEAFVVVDVAAAVCVWRDDDVELVDSSTTVDDFGGRILMEECVESIMWKFFYSVASLKLEKKIN